MSLASSAPSSPPANGGYTKDRFYRFFYRPEGFGWAAYWAARGRWLIRLIGRVFGLGYAVTHPAAVAVVRRNLALLDPQRAGWLNVLRLYMHQGLNFAEYGYLATRPPEEAMRSIGRREGFEHLAAAQKEARGCLLVTAHFGFFEMGGLILRLLDYPIVALTLPEPTPELTKWRADFRGRWGVRTLEVGSGSFAAVEVVRELRAGSFVALLGDRPYDDSRAIVEMPHGRTAFATGPVLISLLAECPIVPVACVRDSDGTYRAIALPPIRPRWLPEGRQATLQKFTEEIAAALRPVLEQYPEQWFQFVDVVA
jgi:KDO2-lipid IV(A) lauroyltransferase